jgi:phosphopantothenoylcysteine synthetase/decarboxylase
LDTKDNISEAKRKLKEKNLDLIVANPAQTLDSENIKPTLIYNTTKGVKVEKLATQSKKSFAKKLMEIISKNTSG